MSDFDDNAKAINTLLADLFEISASYRQGASSLAYSLTFRFPNQRKRCLKLLKDRLKTAGYNYQIDERDDVLLLTVDPRPRFHLPILNIVLFVATLFTVYVWPVFNRQLFVTEDWSEAINRTLAALARGEGVEFTLAMISILFVHEMGHYLASRRRNIVTSLPYFIPAPNIIGTFGAIIRSKTPFWNRRDLIEVGAAGPIAGWVVALIWLWYGLTQSTILPQDAFSPIDLIFSMEGESILMRFSTWLIVGEAATGHFYLLTEAAFAGWVGLLVTAINMLPIGQLDGGHIVYGLALRKQHLLGKIAVGLLIIFGFSSPMWWFFAAIGILFRINHPPTLDDSREVGGSARIMGWLALIILLVSFTPVPFR